jgi:hypothetical protein
MERGKAAATATAPKVSASELTSGERKLSATEQGWVVEWARELEYQYGPASRARRLAQAVADLLADWPDGA